MRTMQELSSLPPEFSALHLYCPSSSGRALSIVREQSPPATKHTISTITIIYTNIYIYRAVLKYSSGLDPF